MSIIHLQRRISEVGRLRIGEQVKSGNKTRPAKLSTWRVTSPDRNRIARIAAQYGGDVREWEAPSGAQWEVITQAESLPVIVPPSDMAFSQHMELWSAGGCQRRCDGVNESIGDQPCVCDPDRPECSIHTRLSVMLRDIPGLGVWRLDTQGYNAALELQGAVEVIQMAAGRGQMLPAQLRLEQRMTKRPGQGTRRFAVPVIDIEISPAQLIGGSSMPALSDPGLVAIEGPRPVVDGGRALDQATAPPPPAPASPLKPVPQTVPETPMAPVKDQAAAPKERKPRKNAAQPVPRTGIKPRTAAQANAAATSNPGAKPEPAQATPPAADTAATEPDGPATGPQNKQINQLFIDAAVEDRESKRQVIVSILGYDVQALTQPEAAKIAEQLEAWKAAGELTEKVWLVIDPLDSAEDSPGAVSGDAGRDGGPTPASGSIDFTEPITDAQKTKLAIIRDERYAKTIKGRGDWFRWVNITLNREADRHVSSNTELTKREAMALIDLLEPPEEPPEDN